MHAIRRLSFLLLFSVIPAMAQVPGLVQHNDESYSWGYDALNDKKYIMVMKQPTSSGNVVIINFTVNSATAPAGLTVTDSPGGNTYTLLSSGGSATNGQFVAQFCGAQTNSAQVFTISATTDLGGSLVKGSATEYFNVATGAGGCTSAEQTWFLDQTTATTSITGGSAKTTTTSGDMIHCFTAEDTGPIQTSFTAGSQSNITWALLPGSGQIWDQMAQQWGVYNSTVAINPTYSWSTAAGYVNSCIALKHATSGSAAPTNKLWVSSFQHGGAFATVSGQSFGPQNATSPVKWQFPTVGNLVVMLFTGDFNTQVTNVTSSVGGETPHQAELKNFNANAGFAAIWYICNTAPSQSRILTVTLNQNIPTNSGETHNFYDISNASTATGTACFDTGGTLSGTQSTVGAAISNTYGPIGAINEIVLATLSVQNSGVIFSAPVSGWNFNEGNMTLNNGGTEINQCDSGVVPPQPIDECNGFGFTVPSSTSSFTVNWNHVTNGSNGLAFGDWVAAWAAFKPAAVASVTNPPHHRIF